LIGDGGRRCAAAWPPGRPAAGPPGRRADWPPGQLAAGPTGRRADWPPGRRAEIQVPVTVACGDLDVPFLAERSRAVADLVLRSIREG
jgi:hypothetical protein